MPLELVNAQSIFRKNIGTVLKKFLYRFDVFYLFDMLAHSRNQEYRLGHIFMVLQKGREVKPRIGIEKS